MLLKDYSVDCSHKTEIKTGINVRRFVEIPVIGCYVEANYLKKKSDDNYYLSDADACVNKNNLSIEEVLSAVNKIKQDIADKLCRPIWIISHNSDIGYTLLRDNLELKDFRIEYRPFGSSLRFFIYCDKLFAPINGIKLVLENDRENDTVLEKFCDDFYSSRITNYCEISATIKAGELKKQKLLEISRLIDDKNLDIAKLNRKIDKLDKLKKIYLTKKEITMGIETGIMVHKKFEQLNKELSDLRVEVKCNHASDFSDFFNYGSLLVKNISSVKDYYDRVQLSLEAISNLFGDNKSFIGAINKEVKKIDVANGISLKTNLKNNIVQCDSALLIAIPETESSENMTYYTFSCFFDSNTQDAEEVKQKLFSDSCQKIKHKYF